MYARWHNLIRLSVIVELTPDLTREVAKEVSLPLAQHASLFWSPPTVHHSII